MCANPQHWMKTIIVAFDERKRKAITTSLKQV
jgi:hypothetical protein